MAMVLYPRALTQHSTQYSAADSHLFVHATSASTQATADNGKHSLATSSSRSSSPLSHASLLLSMMVTPDKVIAVHADHSASFAAGDTDNALRDGDSNAGSQAGIDASADTPSEPLAAAERKPLLAGAAADQAATADGSGSTEPSAEKVFQQLVEIVCPKRESKKNHIKRPMNAFMIFSTSFRGTLREQFPNHDNKLISKMLGDMWAELAESEREKYVDMATQLKTAHRKAHPDWKYNKARKPPVTKITAQTVAAGGSTSPTTAAGGKASSTHARSVVKGSDGTRVSGRHQSSVPPPPSSMFAPGAPVPSYGQAAYQGADGYVQGRMYAESGHGGSAYDYGRRYPQSMPGMVPSSGRDAEAGRWYGQGRPDQYPSPVAAPYADAQAAANGMYSSPASVGWIGAVTAAAARHMATSQGGAKTTPTGYGQPGMPVPQGIYGASAGAYYATYPGADPSYGGWNDRQAYSGPPLNRPNYGGEWAQPDGRRMSPTGYPPSTQSAPLRPVGAQAQYSEQPQHTQQHTQQQQQQQNQHQQQQQQQLQQNQQQQIQHQQQQQQQLQQNQQQQIQHQQQQQ
eukprot:Opistho-2@24662